MTVIGQTMVVTQNVANLFAGPNSDSGMASQALLGDRVIIQEEQDGFSRVATEDRYGGWINSGLLAEQRDDSDSAATNIVTLLADVYVEPDAYSELLTKLVAMTRVVIARRPQVGNWLPISLPSAQIGYVHQTCLNLSQDSARTLLKTALIQPIRRETVFSALGRQIAETAKRFVGTPYLWGGCTPFGLDCSGLTQLVYKLNGVQLLRDAHLQFADRRFLPVELGQSLETAVLDDGDLVVFSRREDKRPTHIGIALGDGRFLHARGGQGVRIDFCDNSEYGKTYVGVIRLSPDADLAIQAA